MTTQKLTPTVLPTPSVMMCDSDTRTGDTMDDWEHDMGELVRTRHRALLGYAYLLSGNVRDAEDLVQDALVKVFSRQVRTAAARCRGLRTAGDLHDLPRRVPPPDALVPDQAPHRERRPPGERSACDR